jgi:predicted transposase YbfD/YdcC
MVEYSTIDPWQAVNENGVVYDQGSLMAHFYDLVDPRKDKGKRYQLVTLLVLVFLAKLSGMDGPSAIADWCQARRECLVALLQLGYPKMPSHHTIRRLFAEVLDEESFEQRMRAYEASQRGAPSQPGLLAIDGKKEHGTMPPGESQGEATLAVYDPEQEQVIAQVAIGAEQGEIPAGQSALGQVELKNKVVLADAMHTQRKLCKQVVAAGGDYVLTLKANQPAIYQAVESLFAPAAPNRNLLDFQTVCKTNKGHGRIEQRRLTALPLFPGEIDWPGIQQVFRLERKFVLLRKGRVVRVEEKVHYGLSSLTRPKANAERLLYLKRRYWQIENGLHYRRDATFHEDATRMSHPHATRNLTTLHNTLLSLFARLGCHNVAQTRRRLDGDLRLAFSLLTSAHPRL